MGPLANGCDISISFDELRTILFWWKMGKWANTCKQNDKAILIAYSEEAPFPDCNIDGPARYTGEARLHLTYSRGQLIHTWLAFRSADGKLRSDSVYCGVVEG